MVSGLHLYSAFLTSQCFTILPNIQPFMQTFTHQRRCQPCKATASLSGAIRVRYLAQRHLDTRRRPGIELATFRLPANPLYLLSHMPPDYTSISEPPSDRSIMENLPNGLEYWLTSGQWTREAFANRWGHRGFLVYAEWQGARFWRAMAKSFTRSCVANLMLLDMFNKSLENGSLPHTLTQAAITLLLKKVKNPTVWVVSAHLFPNHRK